MDLTTNAGERLLSAWLTLSSTLWNERVVTGMTFNEAFICNLLRHQAEDPAEHPLTATDLCERTRLLKSQMNKILSEMERKGYIRRERSEKDKRQILLHLTDVGKAAYAAEHEGVTAILNALVEDLGTDETLRIAEAVEKISGSLQKLDLL